MGRTVDVEGADAPCRPETQWNRSPAVYVQVEVDEYAEDLNLPALPDTVEAYFAQQRTWWRLLARNGAGDS